MTRIFQLAMVAFVIWYYSKNATINNVNVLPEAAIKKEVNTNTQAPGTTIPDFVVSNGMQPVQTIRDRVGNSPQLLRKGHIGTGLRFIICTSGQFPSTNLTAGNAGPFVGEIKIFSPVQDGILPTGWVPCDGRLLPIVSNQMLFALIGTQYGGDGRTTMGVPDLQGSTVVGTGNGWAIAEKSK